MIKYIFPEEESLIKNFKNQLLTKLSDRILLLQVYGSTAKNCAKPDSDIDVLIIVKKNGDDIRQFISNVSDSCNTEYSNLYEHGRWLSPLVIDEEELSHLNPGTFRLLKNVYREGKTLYSIDANYLQKWIEFNINLYGGEDKIIEAGIKEELEIMEKNLCEAELLFKNGFYRGTVAKLYFAMFHSATAALLKIGIERSKHFGIAGALYQYFVKPGKLEHKWQLLIKDAYEERQRADYKREYNDTYFSKERAEKWLDDTKGFINEMKKLIQSIDSKGD